MPLNCRKVTDETPINQLESIMYTFEPGYPYTMPTASIFRDPRPWENGGMRYGRVTALAVTFLTEPEAAAKLLPEPFRLDEEALISVAVCQCEDVAWLAGKAYNLVGVDAHCVFDGEVDKDVHGTFCTIMWENMTETILGGRDHSGVPKVYADITNLMRHGDTCRADVTHFGYPILEVSATGLTEMSADQRTEIEQAKHDAIWMNLKYFPSIENDGADVSYVCTYPCTAECPAAWEGDGELQFFESSFEKNPTQYTLINLLAALPILEVRGAKLIVFEPQMSLARKPQRLR